MKCVHCGQEHPKLTKFCPATGKSIVDAATCPQCGQPVTPEWQHCPSCGGSLSPANNTPAPPPAPLVPKVPPFESRPDPRSMAAAGHGSQLSLSRPALAMSVLLILCVAVFFILMNPPAVSNPPGATAGAGQAATVPAVMAPQLTATSSTSLEQALASASQAFATGQVVYLYDPQPGQVSVPEINSTTFTVRYLVSAGAVEVPSVAALNFVDLQGNREFKMLWDSSGPDWAATVGVFNLNLNRVGDSIDQMREQQGMKTLHVEPAYIEIVVMELEKRDSLLVVGSRALSNAVRIEISGAGLSGAGAASTLPVQSGQAAPAAQGTPHAQPGTPITAANAAQVRQLAVWGGGTLKNAVFSPDGRTIAVGTSIGMSLYSAQTYEQQTVIPLQSSVNSLAYSPDGTILAAGADAGVFLYYPESGQLLRASTGNMGGSVTSLAFSPDGERLAAGTFGGPSFLLQTASGQALRSLDVAWTDGVAFSPDGQTLAIASNGGTSLWDVTSGQVLKRLRSARTHSVAFSPDGKTLATGGAVNALWDLDSGEIVRSFPWQIGAIFSLAFTPDGKTLVSGASDGEVTTWDPATLKARIVIPASQDQVRAVALSADGKLALSGSLDGKISLWDLASGKSLHNVEGHTAAISSLAISPDGKSLAAASIDRTVSLWDLASGKNTGTLGDYSDRMQGVAYSPDGKTLATVGHDGRLSVRDIASGKFLLKLLGRTARPAYSPDGKTLAAEGLKNTVILIDVASGEVLRSLSGHTNQLITLAFSPDGKTLASGGYDSTAILWDVASGQPLHTLQRHTSAVETLAFSPDGRTLASGSTDNMVILWDVSGGEPLNTLKAGSSGVNAVAFSPDGELLASGSTDSMIALWAVATGRQLASLQGHSLQVNSLVFSPDGAGLFSAGDDGTIRTWGLGN